MKRPLAVGFALWLVATGILRFAPAGLLDPSRPVAFIALYGTSFALLFVVFRSFVARPAGSVAALCAGVALVLPTLVLDALASAFFPSAYPNFSPGSAGVFGGWMLICCGGALTGLISRLSQP